MLPDRVANQRSNATPLSFVNHTASFSDRMGGSDPNDFFQFKLGRRSNFRASLTGLSANANLQLLNATGRVLATAAQPGTAVESMALPLNPGTYFVRVYPGSGRPGTAYRLSLSARPILPVLSLKTTTDMIAETGGVGQFFISRSGGTASPLTVNYRLSGSARNGVDYRLLSGRVTIPSGQSSVAVRVQAIDDALLEPSETVTLSLLSGDSYSLGQHTQTRAIADNDRSSFKIQFDYRFDQSGWFTPARRAALQEAGRFWERLILDEFEDVPAATELGVVNPVNDTFVTFKSETAIDDLLVFVGARQVDGVGNTLAYAGPTGHFPPGSRLDMRYSGTDFQPWTGYITFDAAENWFFDSTPATSLDIPAASQDFISTAIHELGHVLGIIRGINAFDRWVVDGTFTGPNARARHGGTPVPLDADESHIQEGFELSQTGETLMDSATFLGKRLLPTVLDLAMLNDIGHRVNYAAAARNMSAG